jgi:hypothetical protein
MLQIYPKFSFCMQPKSNNPPSSGTENARRKRTPDHELLVQALAVLIALELVLECPQKN